MSDLLRKPSGTTGKVHDITPENANPRCADWRYVGFSLYRLRPAKAPARRPASARLSSSWSRARRGSRQRRGFRRAGRSDGCLREDPAALPLSAGRQRLAATADDRLHPRRLLRAGPGGHKAARIGPEGITLTERGKGTNLRHINAIAMEERDVADSLLVTEVFTPAGHWSSYPPHRHDEDDFPAHDLS